MSATDAVEDDAQLTIGRTTQLFWGESGSFVAPVVGIVHGDDGDLRIVTTCAAPLDCDIYAWIGGQYRFVGRTEKQPFRSEAFRIVRIEPGIELEYGPPREPFRARMPRISSPLRTFDQPEKESIGYLAAIDVPVAIEMPGPGGEGTVVETIKAAMMRFRHHGDAVLYGGVIGQDLIDGLLRSAGIVVAIDEDEGHAIMAAPIDLANDSSSTWDDDARWVYAISGASYVDSTTGKLWRRPVQDDNATVIERQESDHDWTPVEHSGLDENDYQNSAYQSPDEIDRLIEDDFISSIDGRQMEPAE